MNALIHKLLLSSSIFIVFLVVLTSSCKFSKSESLKAENVCTLTTEQVPEVRGFRFGMSLEEILKNYPNLCSLPQVRPNSELSITVYKYQTPRPSDKPESIKQCSDFNFVTAYQNEHQELDGVEQVNLRISNNRVDSIKVDYNMTTDSNIINEFPKRTMESLNLSQWTNWKPAEKSERQSEGVFRSDKANQLLCNKLMIETKISVIDKRTPITDSNGTGITAKNESFYFPELSLVESKDVAISEIQRNQMREQEEINKKQRQEEDKRKTGTFKP